MPIPRLMFIFLYRTVLLINFEKLLIEGLILSLDISLSIVLGFS